MNHAQARQILSALHDSRVREADAETREALALLEKDSELRRWWEAEQAENRALAEHLRAIRPPEGWKAELVAAMEKARLEGPDAADSVVTVSDSIWRRPQLWALAACAAVLAGLAWTHMRFEATPPPATYTELRQHIGRLVSSGKFEPSHELAPGEEAGPWLAARDVPQINDLPAFLDGAQTVACTAMEWRGRKIAGLCLEKDGMLMHVFVIRRDQLQDAPREGSVLRAGFDGHQSLAWSSDRHVFVMVGDQTTTNLESLLGDS